MAPRPRGRLSYVSNLRRPRRTSLPYCSASPFLNCLAYQLGWTAYTLNFAVPHAAQISEISLWIPPAGPSYVLRCTPQRVASSARPACLQFISITFTDFRLLPGLLARDELATATPDEVGYAIPRSIRPIRCCTVSPLSVICTVGLSTACALTSFAMLDG